MNTRSSVRTISPAAITVALAVSAILIPQLGLSALMLAGFNRFAAQPFVNLISTFLCLGLYVVIFVTGQGRKARISPELIVLLSLLCTSAAMGLVMGKLSGNPITYVISDTTYTITWIAGIIAASIVFSNISDNDLKHVARQSAIWISGIVFACCLISAASHTPQAPMLKRLAICYIVLFALYPPSRSAWLLAACLFSMSQGIFDANRAIFISAAASIIYLGVATRRAAPVLTLSVASLIGLIVSLPAIMAWLPRSSELTRRIVETETLLSGRATLQNSLASLQRIYESRIALTRLQESNFLNWTFGFGAGATIDARSLPGVDVYKSSLLGLDSLHNLHFLHVAMLYRSGVLGLLLLAAIVVISLMQAMKARKFALRDPNRAILASMFSSLAFSTIIFAGTASNFILADATFGFLIASASALISRSSEPGVPRTAPR